VHAFDGASAGIDVGGELMSDVKSAAGGFPAEGDSHWTINVFAWMDSKPGELTTLAGFGDDTDSAKSQRYFVELNGVIEFWGAGIDVATGTPYDLGKWQMLTATYDGKMLRVYKNAKLIKSGLVQFDKAVPVARLAPPGAWPDAKRFVGKLAGMEVWNRDLDERSVEGLMGKMPG
jgi:alpha-mannosidase